MDVHHKTYRNFGNEKVSELTHVCRQCHQKIHIKARSMGVTMFSNQHNVNLWNITHQTVIHGRTAYKNQQKKLRKEKCS